MNDFFTKKETLEQHREMVDSINKNLDEKIAVLTNKADQILNVFNIISTAVKITDDGTTWLSRNLRKLYPIFIFFVLLWVLFKFGWVAVVHAISKNINP